MRVPSGAYRPPTQSGEIEKNRQKIDVLSRRQQRLPKPPPPPTGGGIVGISRAEALNWNYYGTYMRPLDFYIEDLHNSAGISDSGDGGVKVGAAGYYSARAQVSAGWDADPGYARLEMSSSEGWYNTEQTMPAIPTPYPAFKSETGPTYGPLWLGAGGIIYPIVYWDNTAAVVESFGFVEVTRYG